MKVAINLLYIILGSIGTLMTIGIGAMGIFKSTALKANGHIMFTAAFVVLSIIWIVLFKKARRELRALDSEEVEEKMKTWGKSALGFTFAVIAFILLITILHQS